MTGPRPEPTRMHEDEVLVDAEQVRRLLRSQLPQWADRPLRRVPSHGTDNAMFRLGDDLVVRLPRIGWAVDAVEREQHWLPLVGPLLRVGTPTPVGHGRPDAGFPYPWSVYTWLDGVNPVVGELADPDGLADQVADVLGDLRRVGLEGGPAGGRPVPARDPYVRDAIAQLDGLVDTAPLTRFWDEAVRLPVFEGPPVWLHGDVAPGNLLLTGDRLTGLIDFSGIGVGDPASDLAVGWNLLPATARGRFRERLEADDATWARTTAYAFGQALVQLPYYRITNPGLSASARYVIGEILADRGVSWTDDLGGDRG